MECENILSKICLQTVCMDEFVITVLLMFMQSENPLERMLAVLDRRVGKRSLEKLKETMKEQN